MRPAAYSSPLQPIKTAKTEPGKDAGVGWSRLEKTDFVTNVTRIRGLLGACREALKDGETERADRILAEAQRVLVRLGGLGE
jgi:hypothetical protein